MLPEDPISNDVIGAAIEVHRQLGGPGLLESIYKGALALELMHMGHHVEREVFVPVFYKGNQIHDPLKIDLLVDHCLVIEAKAASRNNPTFAVQCNTYLRLSKLRLGLVINFGLSRIRDGIERVLNPLALSSEEKTALSAPQNDTCTQQ